MPSGAKWGGQGKCRALDRASVVGGLFPVPERNAGIAAPLRFDLPFRPHFPQGLPPPFGVALLIAVTYLILDATLLIARVGFALTFRRLSTT